MNNNNIQQSNNVSSKQIVNNSYPNQSITGNQQVKQNRTDVKTIFSNNNDNLKKVQLKRFKYRVKDADGKIIDSFFDAENRTDVESFLLNKRYDIVYIEEDKLSTSLGLTATINKKMSMKDLNFFLMQLSTYVKSGIPLMDSMEILSRQAKSSKNKMLFSKIVFDLSRGVSFSECLERRGKVFPKMLINMLKTSEMTGDLTGVLDDMAAYYKRQDSNRKQIINAMTYPSVLMIFAIAVLTFVITYVVPSFTKMYSATGSSLPKITLIIMNISNFIINKWYFILGVIFLITLVLVLLYKSSKKVKYDMQFFVMHIPVVSDIIKYNQLVTFTSTFSTLIKHDVFITDSMEILSKITENEIYKKIIDNAISNLSKGNGVSIAFKDNWAFPATAYEMLLTGEKTGKLGEMMEHVSQYYQEEQTNIITRLKSLIEPVMIIALAGLVGVILLSVVVPMFDIYSTMI